MMFGISMATALAGVVLLRTRSRASAPVAVAAASSLAATVSE
jgi:hypothetical protein